LYGALALSTPTSDHRAIDNDNKVGSIEEKAQVFDMKGCIDERVQGI